MKSRSVPFGVCGVAAWCVAVTMTACMGAPPESAPAGPSEAEPIDEAALGVGVGGLCVSTSACDPGLTCCIAPPGRPPGRCRNLLTDHDNCGSCGHVCGNLTLCSHGHCCPLGSTWTGAACVFCIGAGGSCTSDGACCSSLCDNTGVCACVATGFACNDDVECCSGSCLGGACEPP